MSRIHEFFRLDRALDSYIIDLLTRLYYETGLARSRGKG